mmetsp:Transcript_31735/g.69711  ORF Transcript_31735/g.69711 Transcript_31735/m.69711 type:complete len:276 (-) Transcript_31735:1125-1952(-)
MSEEIGRTEDEEDESASPPPPQACTPPPGTPPSSSPSQTARRRSSILKNTNDDSDSDDEGDSSAQKKCSHGRRISFTSVDIQEHDLTLGDHPDCSYGPPTALDWTVKRRHSIDIDDYEDDRCRDTGTNPRRPHRQMVINYIDRRDAIKNAGYTDEDIKLATKKKQRTKELRKKSRTHAKTPAGKMEEFLISAGMKLRRVVKIGPSKKKKKDVAAATNTSRTTTRASVGTEKKESTTPVAATLPAEDLEDADPSSNGKSPADTDDPKKKQTAPASA